MKILLKNARVVDHKNKLDGKMDILLVDDKISKIAGKIEETDWEKLATALGPISEAPIYIDDTPRNFYY